jgi:hypothetical protein
MKSSCWPKKINFTSCFIEGGKWSSILKEDDRITTNMWLFEGSDDLSGLRMCMKENNRKKICMWKRKHDCACWMMTTKTKTHVYTRTNSKSCARILCWKSTNLIIICYIWPIASCHIKFFKWLFNNLKNGKGGSC